ncbi:MAG TPA: hypothetical protein VFX77_00265, partial [Rubrobacter sp.]|nr:hypothetical protein [Rubrobacter sp.]
MRVAIGTFARSGIESRLGEDLAAAVQAALRHYTLRLRSGLQPIGLPDFLRGAPIDASGVDFDLPVEPEVQGLLEREVVRQGTSIEQLTAHAVLVFLADLDEGAPVDCLPEA